MYFIVDRSNSMGSSFRKSVLPGCAFLHRAVAPTSASAVFFGSTVDSFAPGDVGSAAFFESTRVTGMDLEPATRLVDGVKTALDMALKHKEVCPAARVCGRVGVCG